MERREFFRTAALSTAALSIGGIARETAAEPLKAASSSNAPSLLKRKYGKSGEDLSIIGFSGLMLRRMEQEKANRLAAASFEKGVNYYDVAPTYGNAEVIMGPAVEPFRKKIFLACKTKARTRGGAEAELKRSLERLKTDHFDLYQMHHLHNMKEDIDVVFAKGGAMETLIRAKKEGRVRYLGFSAHTVECALAAMDRYEFDSVMFPFNFASYLKAGFGPQVMMKAIEIGAARIAIKGCVKSKWTSNEERKKHPFPLWYKPLTDPREQELGLRFTLSRPITTAMPPMSDTLYLRALDIGMQYKPLSREEEEEVIAMAAKVADPLFPRQE